MKYKNILFSIAIAASIMVGSPGIIFAAEHRAGGPAGFGQEGAMPNAFVAFLPMLMNDPNMQRAVHQFGIALAGGAREGLVGQEGAQAVMENLVRAILGVLEQDGAHAFHGLFAGGGAGFIDGLINAMNAGRLGGDDFGRNFANIARHFAENGEARGMFNEMFEAIIGQGGEHVANMFRNVGEGAGDGFNNFGERAAEGFRNLGQGAGDGLHNLGQGARDMQYEIGVGGRQLLWDYGSRAAFWGFTFTGLTAVGWYGTKALIEYISKPKPALLMNARGGNGYWASFKSIFVTPNLKKIDMVFSPELAQRLKRVAIKLQTTRKAIAMGRDITFGNILLWGPPGTGKTMFAEKLAEESGMDFGKISGASLSQFTEGQAITEIDKLWLWGEQSPNGLVIFIDEADALFANRRELKGEDLKTISHLLAKTGTESKKVILIMTSNYKDRLDEAVYSRVSDSVEMPLPNKPYREKVLVHHIRKKLFNEKNNGNQYVQRAKQVLTPAKVAQIAELTEGLSNRSLHDIVNAIYALSLERDVVTLNIVDTVVQDNLTKMAPTNNSYSVAAAVAA